jgi:hypothetical protein
MTAYARVPLVGEANAAGVPSAGRRTLGVLRVVAVAHALVMLAQPVLAGRYLDGEVDAIALHGLNASVVAGFDVLQLACAVAFFWKGHGRAWPLWSSLAIAVGVEVQVGFGYARILVVHAPLGVSLIVAQILITVWLFRAGSGVARAHRPGRERS